MSNLYGSCNIKLTSGIHHKISDSHHILSVIAFSDAFWQEQQSLKVSDFMCFQLS